MAGTAESASPRAVDAELRLALVCYGGVSLAIYMHGVTKELHKLIVASRRFDEMGDAEAAMAFPVDGPGVDTERVYYDLLRQLARRRRLSVTIDIIAGTSAGGINGVCLGKVLARNGSQEKLKRLWIDEGDLKALLRAPAVINWRVQAVLAALPVLRRPQQSRSPFRGDRMSQLLFDAISDMEIQYGARRSLLRPGQTLDLYVTTTDLHGFEILVPTGAGGVSQRDRSHAQVLRFSGRQDGTAFDAKSTGALAFSARATSCFPGAFPPVSLSSFVGELTVGPPITVAQRVRRLFHTHPPVPVQKREIGQPIEDFFQYNYDENNLTASQAWFVDGGVLDNAPFDLVVKAIGQKAAQTEVIRRLVYIEPDPGRPLDAPPAPDGQPTDAPGWLPALWQGLSSVKGSHAVLRELLTIRDMNTRIREVAAITDSQMQQVNAILATAWSAVPKRAAASTDTMVWSATDREDVRNLSDSMHQEAKDRTGLAYRGYCLLKAEEASRRLADEVASHFRYPPDASRSSFLRSAVAAWLRRRDDWAAADPSALTDYFRPLDLPYRERRLLFIIAGINRLYGSPRLSTERGMARASLDRLKGKAWRLLEELRQASGDVVAGLNPQVTRFLDQASLAPPTVVTDPEDFAVRYKAEFTGLFSRYGRGLREALGDGSSVLWEAYAEETAGWGQDAEAERMSLLSRYLGFPLWDALIFPTVALSRLPQFSPIGVSQFSPEAARAVPPPPRPGRTPGKLQGVSLHHFGGFTEAAWRENDYLWGRLDGAELILRTLRNAASGAGYETPPATPEEAVELAGRNELRAALSAILEAEKDLAPAQETLQYVRNCVEKIGRLS
jgi:patatin-related protein